MLYFALPSPAARVAKEPGTAPPTRPRTPQAHQGTREWGKKVPPRRLSSPFRRHCHGPPRPPATKPAAHPGSHTPWPRLHHTEHGHSTNIDRNLRAAMLRIPAHQGVDRGEETRIWTEPAGVISSTLPVMTNQAKKQRKSDHSERGEPGTCPPTS